VPYHIYVTNLAKTIFAFNYNGNNAMDAPQSAKAEQIEGGYVPRF
jgi:hypothetical protein